jgi:hypothetical protein
MSYDTALEAAGAEVLDFQMFGDYQGTWIAKVKYNGEIGYVQGCYGSCSVCDAFEAEFDYSYDDKPDHQERLAKFGKSYLNHILSLDELVKEHYNDVEDWDLEGAGIKKWVMNENSTRL